MKRHLKRIFSAALCVMMLATMVLPNITVAKAEEPATTKKNLYVFDLETYINKLPKEGTARYDYLKLATALQGLVNRKEPQLYYLFETNSFAKKNDDVDMDQYWLDKLSESGKYLSSFEKKTDVKDFFDLLTIFKNYYKGIVLWDPDVPATSNVASTVAGADDLLPVRYSTGEGSLWATLKNKSLFTDSDVKVNLVDKFVDDAETIPNSTTASTGSAKNDAYIWAKEQYLDTGKTSADLMTYTVDAWDKNSVTERVVNDAEFVSVELPSIMRAKSEVEIKVTVRNVGTASWTATELYRLSNHADDSSPFKFKTAGHAETNRMFIADNTTVKPDDTYTFTTKLVAPAASGTYELSLDMVQDGNARFGDQLTRSITVVGGTSSSGAASSFPSIDLTKNGVITTSKDGITGTGLNAEFVDVKIPTQMAAGATATVSVKVKNTGSETWALHVGGNANDAGMRLGTCSFDAAGNRGGAAFTWSGTGYGGTDRALLSADAAVAKDDTYTFNFTITAPTTPGKTKFVMQMVRDGAGWYGQVFTYEIDVVDISVKTVDLTADGVLTTGTTVNAMDVEFMEVSLPVAMVTKSTADVSVKVKNTGTTSWSDNYVAGIRLGRPDGADDFGWKDNKNASYGAPNRAFLVKDQAVDSEDTYTFNFTITAPDTTGEKTFKAEMVGDDGAGWFGNILTYTINVIADTTASENSGSTDTGSTDDDTYTDEDFKTTLETINNDTKVIYSDLMNTMLPNADYYIANKAFFWDLSPDDSIAPIDDRNQKVGTDVATLNAILASQQERAEAAVEKGDKTDAVFTVSGFVPWWLKYTTTSDPGHSTMGDVPSEWKMVDIISKYMGQIDADAYGMTSISNASVFTHVPLNENLKQKGTYNATKTDTSVTYDKDTKYILFYMGDYDAASWTSGCLPLLWDDAMRGKRTDVPLAWAVCSDLSNSVPHVFNYLYETATENDYFVAGDNGTGYLNPMQLNDQQLEIWKQHNITANEKFDIDVQGFLISGNSGSVSEKVQKAYNAISPVGVGYQGGVANDIYEGVGYAPAHDIGGELTSDKAAGTAKTIADYLKEQGQFHVLRSILTSPSVIYDIVDELAKTGTKFKVLDPYTFFKLYTASEGGTKPPVPTTYEAEKASNITVDGVLNEDEWADAKEIVVSVTSEDVKNYGININVSDTDAVSAKFKLKWDENYLYVSETLSDEKLLPMNFADEKETLDGGKSAFLYNDATMLFLDLNGQKSKAYLAGDYAVYYTFNENGEPVVFLRKGQATGSALDPKLDSTQYKAKFKVDFETNTAVMELALPWTLFDTTAFTPKENLSVGMSVLVIDHDVTTDTAGRQLQWCGTGDDQIGWAEMKFVNNLSTVTVDKTALKAAIDAAEAIDLSKYQNGAEKDAFVAALAAAKTVYAKENATKDEVNNATTALTEAQNGLKRKTGGSIPTVNTTVSNPVKHPFLDVGTGAWYSEDVQFVYEKGLMSGISSNEFAPDATVTRAMVATILWRMEGEPAAKSGTDFTDVEKNQWYSDAIAWTAQNGIFGGYGNGLFGTNDPITREQLATILYRYAQYKGRNMSVSGSLSAFADGAQVSTYAADAMQWCVGAGLLNGADGKLNPTGTATRAQLAAILHRFSTL